MAATPPKKNFNPKRGMKKARYPFTKPKQQSGLGSAYNSTTDQRGPDAYVPVPDSRGATQRPNRGRSSQAKPGLEGYGPGSQFLKYDKPNPPAKKPKGKVRRKTGDGWIG